MLHSPPLSPPNRWSTRLFTFALAAAAAASAVFWVLQWPGKASASLAAISTTPIAAIDSQQVAALLGASPATEAEPTTNAPATDKVQLLGVIAVGGPGSPGHTGSALMAVTGASAKPYRVGDEVTDGLVLQAVKTRSVVLGRAGQTQGLVTLELPLLPGMTGAP